MGWFVVGFMVLLAVLLIPAYVYDQRRRRMATDRLPLGLCDAGSRLSADASCLWQRSPLGDGDLGPGRSHGQRHGRWLRRRRLTRDG